MSVKTRHLEFSGRRKDNSSDLPRSHHRGLLRPTARSAVSDSVAHLNGIVQLEPTLDQGFASTVEEHGKQG